MQGTAARLDKERREVEGLSGALREQLDAVVAQRERLAEGARMMAFLLPLPHLLLPGEWRMGGREKANGFQGLGGATQVTKLGFLYYQVTKLRGFFTTYKAPFLTHQGLEVLEQASKQASN